MIKRAFSSEKYIEFPVYILRFRDLLLLKYLLHDVCEIHHLLLLHARCVEHHHCVPLLGACYIIFNRPDLIAFTQTSIR